MSVGYGCRHSDGASEAAALRQVLAGQPAAPITSVVWMDVREFYRRRNDSLIWVSQKSPSKAMAALRVLRNAREHGFASTDYDERQLVYLLDALPRSKGDAAEQRQQLAEVDAAITAALLSFGRDVAVGRTAPQAIDRRWRAHRKAPDLVVTLSSAEHDPKTWLDAIRPPHRDYAALQSALVDLYRQRERGGWPQVPSSTLEPGMWDPSVVLLRRRLAAGGELRGTAAASVSPAYDKDIEAAVRAFQDHHAMKPTGIADAAALAAMNVPIEDRIRQVVLNLHRWRWMPDELGQRHLMVNIPSYHLVARENGSAVLDMRVVVGKLGHETPIFSAEMTTVVFSPYWNIPDTIVEAEMAPAVARDSEYLTRHNIEILQISKSGAARVDPSSVDWSDPGELRQLAFRQRPGSDNALGHVKFLLPNDFDVYLHDTPADALFARQGRALSHGCIRLEEPDALAAYILRDHSDWDAQRVREAMRSGEEKHVKLKDIVPVHIAYFTAWVDEAGGLHFEPDVYGYDAKQFALWPADASPLLGAAEP